MLKNLCFWDFMVIPGKKKPDSKSGLSEEYLIIFLNPSESRAYLL